MRQFFTAFAHETDLSGRIANDQAVGSDIPNDYRARTDESVTADRHTAYDGDVGSNTGTLKNPSGHELVVIFFYLGAGVKIVGENRVGTNKYIVAKGDAVPDGDAILNGDAIANGDVRFHEGVVADVTVSADDGTLHHVSKGPNASAFPDRLRFDQGARMYEIGLVRHK